MLRLYPRGVKLLQKKTGIVFLYEYSYLPTLEIAIQFGGRDVRTNHHVVFPGGDHDRWYHLVRIHPLGDGQDAAQRQICRSVADRDHQVCAERPSVLDVNIAFPGLAHPGVQSAASE